MAPSVVSTAVVPETPTDVTLSDALEITPSSRLTWLVAVAKGTAVPLLAVAVKYRVLVGTAEPRETAKPVNVNEVEPVSVGDAGSANWNSSWPEQVLLDSGVMVPAATVAPPLSTAEYVGVEDSAADWFRLADVLQTATAAVALDDSSNVTKSPDAQVPLVSFSTASGSAWAVWPG